MSELPMPTPQGDSIKVVEADVRRVLKGIPPGLYSTAELYPRYQSLMTQEGRTPSPAMRVGIALRMITGHSAYKVRGNVSVWDIEPEMTR